MTKIGVVLGLNLEAEIQISNSIYLMSKYKIWLAGNSNRLKIMSTKCFQKKSSGRPTLVQYCIWHLTIVFLFFRSLLWCPNECPTTITTKMVTIRLNNATATSHHFTVMQGRWKVQTLRGSIEKEGHFHVQPFNTTSNNMSILTINLWA